MARQKIHEAKGKQGEKITTILLVLAPFKTLC
jgi:hypothetical protein